jgi:hypothetical protein
LGAGRDHDAPALQGSAGRDPFQLLPWDSEYSGSLCTPEHEDHFLSVLPRCSLFWRHPDSLDAISLVSQLSPQLVPVALFRSTSACSSCQQPTLLSSPPPPPFLTSLSHHSHRPGHTSIPGDRIQSGRHFWDSESVTSRNRRHEKTITMRAGHTPSNPQGHEWSLFFSSTSVSNKKSNIYLARPPRGSWLHRSPPLRVAVYQPVPYESLTLCKPS